LIRRVEAGLIARALTREGGDHEKAARLLGISKASLKKRVAAPESEG
jgi:transcriptional regulator with PAS, ATPase and Fis domain